MPSSEPRRTERPNMHYPPKKLSCKERDEQLRPDLGYPGWSVHASLTDVSGQFGEPRIITSRINDRTRQVIEDIRYPDPNGGEDRKRCIHYDHGILPPEPDDGI